MHPLLGKRVEITANDGTYLGPGTCIEVETLNAEMGPLVISFLLDSGQCIMHAQCAWTEIEGRGPALNIPVWVPPRIIVYDPHPDNPDWIRSSGKTLHLRARATIKELVVKKLSFEGLPEDEFESFVAFSFRHVGTEKFLLASDLGLPLYGVD